jgi:hypothetical protein
MAQFEQLQNMSLERELMLEAHINKEYDMYCAQRQEWTEGRRTAENATIKEWEYLNKPRNGK